MKKRATLLDDIEAEVLDSDASLAGALRKCVALGGHAGSRELRDWAAKEVRGYKPGADDMPHYRTVPAALKVDWRNMACQATGQLLSPMQLPEFAQETVKEEMTLYHGVGELEAMLRQAREKGGYLQFGFPQSTSLVAYLNMKENSTGQVVDRLYHEVSAVSIAGVLDEVRTTLVEMVAEMRDGPSDERGVPSADSAAQAVTLAVTGNRNRVRVVSAQAAGGSAKPDEAPWWKRWQVASALIAGLATLTGGGFFLVQRLLG
jgi:hypothetical protein